MLLNELSNLWKNDEKEKIDSGVLLVHHKGRMFIVFNLWPVHLLNQGVSSREDAPHLGHLAPASEVAQRHALPFKKGHYLPILKFKSTPVTYEDGATWPRCEGVFPRRHIFAE
jgi:hypothetical protein